MSAWKSRWSWVRLVKRPISKWIASARCRLNACEETSIAQASSPPSSICRNVPCSSTASGVVRTTSFSTPPRRLPPPFLPPPADDLLHGPQQPAAEVGGLQDLADEEGGRRLPVRAG